MLKKLTLLAMSVGALLAFAAPAAQANGPLITNSLGEAPTEITALSTNTKTVTEAGTLECTTVDLSLHITENANTTATGHGSGSAKGTPTAQEPAKHNGHCASSGGLRVDIESVTVKHIHLTKHGEETTGTATFTYTFKLTTSGGSLIAHCTFGNPTEKATVKKTGANTMHVSGKVVKTAGSAFCPSSGTLTGDFTVTDKPAGLPVTIH